MEMIDFGSDIGLSITTEQASYIDRIYLYQYERGFGVILTNGLTGEHGLHHSSVRKDLTLPEANELRKICQNKVEDAKRRNNKSKVAVSRKVAVLIPERSDRQTHGLWR